MKKRIIGWSLAAVATGATLMASTGDASASIQSFEGYVCEVNVYSTGVSSLPTATLYAQPGCTGTYLGLAHLARIGGTYPEQSDRLYQATLAAVTSDRRVTGTWDVNLFGKYVETLQVNAD